MTEDDPPDQVHVVDQETPELEMEFTLVHWDPEPALSPHRLLLTEYAPLEYVPYCVQNDDTCAVAADKNVAKVITDFILNGMIFLV